MKKFVLLNIPSSENAYHSFKDFIAVFPPIGLITIAAVLEKLDYTVKIIDGDAENLSMEETIHRVLDESPDYVGSTTMTSIMDITGEFYLKLKEKLPNVTVIVGGPHVSAIPKQTLKEFSSIDIVVIGEGDETTVDLMTVLEQGENLESVDGIGFRRNGEISITPLRPPIKDLSNTISPAFHLLNFDLYRSYGWNSWVNGNRAPLGVVFAARGCYGKCNFCASHCVFGQGIRFFPMERIKSEIDLLVNEYNIRILYFQDDTFTVNRRIVNEICDYIIAKGYNKKLEIMVSARVDMVHPPTFKKMREAGVRWICFGVESGSQCVLDRMGKRITINQVEKAFKEANAAGLYVSGNYMIGHLEETWETAMETIDLACRLKQDYASFAIAIPFPGTKLYNHCLDNDIKLPTWNYFGSVNTPPIPLNKTLDCDRLIKLRTIAINRFFKRPLYLTGLFRKFNALAVIKDFAKMYFAVKIEKMAKRF